MLTSVNIHLPPAADQPGFRPEHSTTSALLQLTSGIATGFNQMKPPHRTICVAVDLTAAFNTVNYNILLSNITRSTLPEATCRWLSNYNIGRQSATNCRGVKSKARIVHTSVPKGSKLCCCCLPTPLTLVRGGGVIPLLVHQPAYLSIWPAAPSLQRGPSTNPGVTVRCVCGCS